MEQADRILTLFQGPLVVINIGLEKFMEHLSSCGVEAIQVDWKPPAGGNPELVKKLKKLTQNGGDS